MVRAAKEITLFLKRNVVNLVAGKILQRLGYRRDIVMDQLLGAEPGFGPQRIVGHPVHVAVDAFV